MYLIGGIKEPADALNTYLDSWSLETDLGEVAMGPGVFFSNTDNVVPDVAWVSKARLPMAPDEAGHLIEAPDLAIEVLSLGSEKLRRDRQLTLRLYST